MVIDMLYRHWVTIFSVLLFSIEVWSRKKFRNTDTKYFWMTVLCCILLVIQDSSESICAMDPSLRFFRIFLSVVGYTLRSAAALSLLLVVVPERKRTFLYYIPALITLAVNSTAFFSGIAFGYNEKYEFYRGPLGYVAFIVPIFYLILILCIVLKRFAEKNRLEKYILHVCVVFCLSASFLDSTLGGVRLNEAIIISSVFFYLVLFANNNRRDSLTGLLNRQAFYDDCNLYNRSIGAVASLDMNGLKDLNDSCGHQAGDKALKTIGDCMLKSADSRTFAYRVGGDEFIMLFLHSNKDHIAQIEKKIIEDVTGAGYSISTGYALRGETSDLEELIRESDDVMYKAKADYYRSIDKEQRVDHYQVKDDQI